MTPIHWRRAGPADAQALSILGAATTLASFANDHVGSDLVSYIAEHHNVPCYERLLADHAYRVIIGETPLGAPVAYGVLGPCRFDIEMQPGDLELQRIYLLGPWQGSGNGKRLLDLLSREAHAIGARRLVLAVYENNLRARHFYAGQGFREIGKARYPVGNSVYIDPVYARTVAAPADQDSAPAKV